MLKEDVVKTPVSRERRSEERQSHLPGKKCDPASISAEKIQDRERSEKLGTYSLAGL